MTPTTYTVAGLGALLALSVLGNVGLGRAYMAQHERLARTEEAREQALGAATKCGDAVRQLQDTAKRQADEAKTAIEAAQKFAGQQRKAAEAERRRAQAVPGNACASAEVETREWLLRRQGAAK